MKMSPVLLCCLLVLLGCNQHADKQGPDSVPQPGRDTVTSQTTPGIRNPDSKLYIWRATPDYQKMRNKDVSVGTLNADSLIKGLNAQYENILLEKVKISGDTIYTAIKNASYLAEQMGSTGAEIYVADVVLNLTEVPGLKYVNIQLEEGSHMQPGVWSAENFKKFTEAK